MKEIRKKKYHNWCILLAETCDKFNKAPSDYLFNHLDCVHTKMVIDMTFFEIYAEWRDKLDKKAKKKQDLRNAHQQSFA